MPKTDYTACKPDHRMMRVEMTPKMREIAEQIAALQAQYRKLEEAEQRRALHAFLQGVRQRAETRATLEALRHAADDPAPGARGQDAGAAASPSGETLARQLVADALVYQAEAELRWLDRAAERLAEHPARTLALELDLERPRRGRPPLVAAPIG